MNQSSIANKQGGFNLTDTWVRFLDELTDLLTLVESSVDQSFDGPDRLFGVLAAGFDLDFTALSGG